MLSLLNVGIPIKCRPDNCVPWDTDILALIEESVMKDLFLILPLKTYIHAAFNECSNYKMAKNIINYWTLENQLLMKFLSYSQ